MHQRCRERPLHDLLHAIARFFGVALALRPRRSSSDPYLPTNPSWRSVTSTILTGHERCQIVNGLIEFSLRDAISLRID